MTHGTDVQRKAQRAGDAVKDITRCGGKVVGDMIGKMMDACKDGDVGDAELMWARTGERVKLGGGVREESNTSYGLFEGEKG